MNQFIRCLSYLVLVGAVAAASNSCAGGGSVGTGTGDARQVGLQTSYEGTVTTLTGSPIAGARITKIDSGEDVVTDPNGNFQIIAPPQGGDIPFEIHLEQVVSEFVVRNVSTEPSTVKVSLAVDKKVDSIKLDHIEVLAQLAGPCRKAFMAGRTFYQSDLIDNGTQCIVNVQIKGDGKPLGEAGFVIQHRNCDDTSDWNTVSSSATDDNGKGDIRFTYLDNPRNCVFRLVAPFPELSPSPVVYEFRTLRKQEFDASQNP